MSSRQDVWSVVPVKAFDLAKQRLARAYPPGLRRDLAQAMLEDVLDILSAVKGIAGIAVVTVDPDAGRLARARGAEVFAEEEGGGLNEALAAAARRLALEQRGSMLMVAGDVPGITVREVDALLALHGERRGLTLVPAHDRRGTNALLLSPPDAMPLRFGANSFARHLRSGRAAGLEPRALPLPHIGLDLDHPRDVATFARTPSPTRTWRYLSSQGLVAGRERERIA